MAGRMKRRILHTSDLHLESLGDRACCSLEAAVNLAISAKVDLVIIAGDLFDHNRVNDDLVSFVAEQLQRLPIWAVILPGNHDCLDPDSIYHRAALWQGASNVRIFRAPQGETFVFSCLGMSVWGRPIGSYERDIRPLAGIPKPQEKEQWHIAVAHGYYYNSAAPLSPSYHITHEEVVASGQDYIALGHLITFSCVCDEPPVKAYYCDSPTLSGTVNIVDLAEEMGVRVQRCPLWLPLRSITGGEAIRSMREDEVGN